MYPPASGTGVYSYCSPKVIRLLRKGCTNRPFYHIVVAVNRAHQSRPVIEQVGTYDPMVNQYNEKLVALNYERIRFWIGNGTEVSRPVAQLLGLSGFYPIHPTSYMTAWRNREKMEKEVKQQAEEGEGEKDKNSISQ
ncbi:probable 28S ribosomal protein S16, mitochondrial [Anthonomus grandis grandis]|uniref:probable 28S ribosomal protein S16, mitochondrial n=1 Tax=Anthonomus grandis grandis TaxID=2921223 RepID=UPI0021666FB6|nr:probable 28S ribosomal protein S16, mitochondrial [Anthonomus grandis grandis]